jgi:hypothetical protein
MHVRRRHYCSALRRKDTSVCSKEFRDDDEIDVGEIAYDRISAPGKRYKYEMIGKSHLGRRDDSEAARVSAHSILHVVAVSMDC